MGKKGAKAQDGWGWGWEVDTFNGQRQVERERGA